MTTQDGTAIMNRHVNNYMPLQGGHQGRRKGVLIPNDQAEAGAMRCSSWNTRHDRLMIERRWRSKG